MGYYDIKNYKQRAQKNTRYGNCDTCKYRGTCRMKWTENRCIQHREVVKIPYDPAEKIRLEEEKIRAEVARRVAAIKKHKEEKERSGK